MENIRKAIRQIIRETYVEEGGFSRTMRTMTGNVPEVDKMVILTAANPGGQPMYPKDKVKSAEFNNKQMAKLYSILSDWKYGYVKIKGFYDYPEPSVLIGGMSKSEGKKLAAKFGQESFIFGYRKDLDNGGAAMVYELCYLDGSSGGKSEIVTSTSAVQSYDNFYSEIKGRKFQIPFFDDAFSKKRLVVGRGEPEDMEPESQDARTYRQKQSLKGKERKSVGDEPYRNKQSLVGRERDLNVIDTDW